MSSALAAPALAGIPVTHRGIASGFAVLSGHADQAWMPILDGIAPASMTLVVLMGFGARSCIAAALLARGWPPATPAAALLGASTPAAHAWFGDLRSLGDADVAEGSAAPGTICVGPVVALAEVLGPALAAGRALP